MLQGGTTEASLLTLEDRAEHARLRKHMNAFFTPENVNTVYVTLRDAVTDAISTISQVPNTKSANGKDNGGVSNGNGANNGGTGSNSIDAECKRIGVEGADSDGWVAVDAWCLTHMLILKVVMEV